MKNYENHLWPLIYDQYNQGRHEKELEFYWQQLKNRAGKALEVACGTGMIFLQLLQRGLDICGFDISGPMLNILEEKAAGQGLAVKDRIANKDMTNFSYPGKFDDIFIPARSFLHLLTQQDQISCLRSVWEHLNDGGRFLLNFFNPDLSRLVADAAGSDKFKLLGTYEHPYLLGEKIDLYYNQKNDIPTQIQHIIWKFSYYGTEHFTNMALRWLYKEEFQLLLMLSGFREWELYGDFDKSPYSQQSPELIWVAKK